MRQSITEKSVKEHIQCSCGYNSVMDYRMEVSHKDLRTIGRRKVYANTNEPFYLLTYNIEHTEPHDE